jgi:hypothetical protein
MKQHGFLDKKRPDHRTEQIRQIPEWLNVYYRLETIHEVFEYSAKKGAHDFGGLFTV